MKVLMLGWEFPPFIAGGLGTACYGLTRAMNGLGVNVLFVLPRPVVAHAPTSSAPPSEQAPNPKSPAPTVSLVGTHYHFPHAHHAADHSAETAGPESDQQSVRGTDPGAALKHSPFVSYDETEFEHVTFKTLDAMLSPYVAPAEYRRLMAQRQQQDVAGPVPPGQPTAKKAGQKKAGAEAPPAAEVTPTPATGAPVSFDTSSQFKSVPLPPIPESMLSPPHTAYAADLLGETQRYATLVAGIAGDETFDVIHAHDWMTFRAGVAAREISGKPLIAHVHSTEYDRNPHRPDAAVIAIEAEGLAAADLVIAVSHMTRRLLITRYGVDEEKIEVVHNAIDGDQLSNGSATEFPVRKDEKVVLFLGRITAQKGPEYFLAAARKVLDVYEPVKFVMAGAGDLMKPTIELAAAMGIGHKVLFTGFLNARDVERIYQMADLYVMPSVSEPFGIAPLEALSHNVPVIVSKQSGVAEILKHALKVDFWDIDALADRILAVLRHAPLATTLREHAREEVRKLSWVDAARRVMGIYQQLAAASQPV